MSEERRGEEEKRERIEMRGLGGGEDKERTRRIHGEAIGGGEEEERMTRGI